MFVSNQLGIDKPNQLGGMNNFCLGRDSFESESSVNIKNSVWITVIKFLVLESRQPKPKMVCRKEGGDGGAERASTWQPLCGWCHVALLGLFRLERLIKYFPLPQCINLVSMRKISGNGEGRDAWFHVRLMCVCSDSGRHRGQRDRAVAEGL